MSAVLPDPPPLDLPDEDPSALADTVYAVSGAAFQLGVLVSHLAGPAATAPGWLGDDAAAAAAQAAAVAEVARAAHEALGTAAGRLGRHADLLAETRRAIVAMRTEQEDDYAAASSRLADVLLHPPVPTSPAHPAVVVVLGDELRTANARRLRRHGALLAELHADAVETAGALGTAAGAVGGTGRPGDGARVVAELAARLPGWGNGELSARGAELARTLLGPGTRDELESRARAALPYAGSTPFADALLRVLGRGGLRSLLLALPIEGLDAGSATARLLAGVLGAAERTGSVMDPVGEVLDATYVRERASGTDDDLVALGLATVLAAAPSGPGAIPAATVARWGGQVLDREQWWRSVSPGGARARDRAGPMYATAPDPVAEVVRFLGAAGDPAAAGTFAADRASWDLLLGRPELAVHEPAALRRFIEVVASDPSAAGDRVIRAGLDALGSGTTGNDAAHWQVARSMADAVSFPLASALARHPDVLSALLQSAAGDRAPSPSEVAALRALGYLSLDPGAASVLDASVAAWARSHADVHEGSSLAAGPLAVGAFVAVRQYGQRLAYALHGSEARDAARAAESFWNWTVGLAVNLVPKTAGAAAGFIEPFAAHFLGYDGSWDNGRDTGLSFDRDDAAAVAEVELGANPGGADDAVGAAAATAFARASRALGVPLPPVPPDWCWWQVALDALPFPEVPQMLTDEEMRRLKDLLG